jgi:hypothetical protein
MAKKFHIEELVRGAETYEKEARRTEGSDRLLHFSKAEFRYQQALKRAEKHFVTLTLDTLGLRDKWAISLRETGQVEAAIACNHQAVRNYEIVEGPHHRGTLDALRRLAENLLEARKFSGAIEKYETVVYRVNEANFDPRVIWRYSRNLAVALYRSDTLKNIKRAVNISLDTLGLAEKAFGMDNIDVFHMRYELGVQLDKLQKTDDALKQFETNVKRMERSSAISKTNPYHNLIFYESKSCLEKCRRKLQNKSAVMDKGLEELEKKDNKLKEPSLQRPRLKDEGPRVGTTRDRKEQNLQPKEVKEQNSGPKH